MHEIRWTWRGRLDGRHGLWVRDDRQGSACGNRGLLADVCGNWTRGRGGAEHQGGGNPEHTFLYRWNVVTFGGGGVFQMKRDSATTRPVASSPSYICGIAGVITIPVGRVGNGLICLHLVVLAEEGHRGAERRVQARIQTAGEPLLWKGVCRSRDCSPSEYHHHRTRLNPSTRGCR